MFIDTHTHLHDEAFAPDFDAAVERAVEAGVARMILPDTDSSAREALFELAGRHPGVCFPTAGLHPEEVRENWKEELGMVEAEVRDIVAIGEIGLDYHWSTDFAKEQVEVFRAQLEIAQRKDLPVIVHMRDATEATLSVVREFKGRLRGVFHAYAGSLETFRELQRLGDWYVGIGGVCTYKNASIAQTIKDIPLERILLETDSPYLTPVPHRGKRNESAYIPLIAQKIAEQKGIGVEEVERITTTSAISLFSLQ